MISKGSLSHLLTSRRKAGTEEGLALPMWALHSPTSGTSERSVALGSKSTKRLGGCKNVPLKSVMVSGECSWRENGKEVGVGSVTSSLKVGGVDGTAGVEEGPFTSICSEGDSGASKYSSRDSEGPVVESMRSLSVRGKNCVVGLFCLGLPDMVLVRDLKRSFKGILIEEPLR